jgi:glycosyltransferase involved in cell wall biosynthesis
MKLLRIISTLNPTYGGPVEALRQSVRAFHEMGHCSEVVTLDAPTATWLQDFPATVHALGPTYLGYYCFTPRLIPWLKQNALSYDIIIVEGIWKFHSFGTWLASREKKFSYYVFIHGALDPWFKRTYPLKHFKKWLYWPWSDYHTLRNAHSVFFTTDEEKILARNSFWLYQANEQVVSLGIAAPPPPISTQREKLIKKFPELIDKHILLYLGRIDPIKGCDMLLQAWGKFARSHPDWILVMAGPDPSGLRLTLEKKIFTSNVLWTGMLTGDLKWGVLHASDVFILPSHHENFGIAVVEALACGVPVLISDKVNIWREIEQSGAGLVAPDTIDGTQELLFRWFSLSEHDRMLFKERAVPCFKKYFEVEASVANLVKNLGDRHKL